MECLDCGLTRDTAEADDTIGGEATADQGAGGGGLAAEVARALDRLRGRS